MNTIRTIALALIMIWALPVLTDAAGAGDGIPICVTARLGSGLGAATLDVRLITDLQLPFAELAGEAQFSQPVSPPASLIIYAVSGAAIPNTDGVWVSLAGTGYDLAKTIYRGTIAIQLSLDPTKNTLSYTRQNLDGSSASTSTGVPTFVGCPR